MLPSGNTTQSPCSLESVPTNRLWLRVTTSRILPLNRVLPSRFPLLVILPRTVSPVIAPPFWPSGMYRSSCPLGSEGTRKPNPRLLWR